MAVSTTNIQEVLEKPQGEAEDLKELETPDVHNVAERIKPTEDAYKVFARLEDQPTNIEIVLWYIYSLCSEFIHAVLLPIIFPLIISQMVDAPPQPHQGWDLSFRGLSCRPQEMKLYEAVTHPSIGVKNSKFSPLIWASVSWAAGVFLSAPILASTAFHLDYAHSQSLISGGATVIGALFCLPAGFFKSAWLFAPYTAVIVAASNVAAAGHTRHLGLMVRGFTGTRLGKLDFPARRAIISWLSLYGTAAGAVGSTIIVAFTYRMLRRSDKLLGLWIVSIFCGLKWLVGAAHAFGGSRSGPLPEDDAPNSSNWAHTFQIFKYPHAAGSVVGVLFSSFATMCIFTAGMLYVAGGICVKPVFFLSLWIIYFIFPLFSLPILHPLQLIIRADALRMQLFGLLISAFTSGTGFFFRKSNWQQHQILILVLLQSMAAGVVHAFGRVLLLDCAPPGREGSFSVWYVWVKAAGTCAGFAVASAFAGDVATSFGIAFCAVIVGVVILIFGNISNFGGAVAAGHVKEQVSEVASPVHGLDKSGEWKDVVHTLEEGERARVVCRGLRDV